MAGALSRIKSRQRQAIRPASANNVRRQDADSIGHLFQKNGSAQLPSMHHTGPSLLVTRAILLPIFLLIASLRSTRAPVPASLFGRYAWLRLASIFRRKARRAQQHVICRGIGELTNDRRSPAARHSGHHGDATRAFCRNNSWHEEGAQEESLW